MLPHYFAYTATLPMLVVAIVSFAEHSSMALCMPCGADRRRHLVIGTLQHALLSLLQQRKVLTGEQIFLYTNLGFRTRSDSVRTRLGLGPKSVCPIGFHKSITFFLTSFGLRSDSLGLVAK